MKQFACTPKVWEDFKQYCRIQLSNNDLDPEYLILDAWLMGWPLENKLWAVLLHMAYCQIISFVVAWELGYTWPHLLGPEAANLPINVERRGFRGGGNRINKYIQEIVDIVQHHGSLEQYFTAGFGDDPYTNWALLSERVRMIWGNGRWATYKICEIMMNVCWLPVAATDMDMANSSGPRQGLALLFPEITGNSKQNIFQLDWQARFLLALLAREGFSMKIDQLETMLCEFHGMTVGRYYPGHDIDLLQEQIEQQPLLLEKHKQRLYDMRHQLFPEVYLGEVYGWSGIDPARKKYYQTYGRIPVRGIDIILPLTDVVGVS
jgi:hypothetical protein